MKKLRLATVFSGIGAIEQALKEMNIEHEIIFASDNGGVNIYKNKTEEEKEELEKYIESLETMKEKKEYVDTLYQKSRQTNFVKQSYFANYEITEDKWYNDVIYIDGKKYHNEIDLFVGGSPCQSFSMIGERGGLDDARGTLFYQYARLVKEIQPKVFIYENVKGLLNHDKGNTWKVCSNIFNELGYKWSFKVVDAKKQGIPQSRPRVFVVGFKEENNFDFPKEKELKKTLKDYLDKEVDEKYYLSKKGVLSVTNPKNTKKKYTQINGDIALCQTAQQQFNLKGTFIYDGDDIEKITSKSRIRRMTPKECLKLMGFNDFKQVVSDNQMWKQSGNSIVVDVLVQIMEEIMKTKKL